MSASIPRILHAIALAPGRKFGSAEEQICILASHVEMRGGKLIALFTTGDAGSLADFRERGVDARSLNLERLDFGTLTALVRLVRRERIDVVHWHFVEMIRNPYLWALTLLCPSVRHWFTDHISRPAPTAHLKSSPPAFWALKGRLARRYDSIFCVSGFVRNALAQESVRSGLAVEHHFINTERFRPDLTIRRQVREEQDAAGKVVAILVAHLIPQKGVEVALHALANAPRNVCLWIIGEGPDEQKLRTQCQDLGLVDRVRMLGPQSQIQRYMQGADVLLCPSLWAEAAGLVNLEAQACGVPVIASRIGGIPEYVADEQTGLLFTPGDCADLARQLTRFVDEPGLRERLARAARLWIVEKFSVESRMPQILDNYRRLGGLRAVTSQGLGRTSRTAVTDTKHHR